MESKAEGPPKEIPLEILLCGFHAILQQSSFNLGASHTIALWIANKGGHKRQSSCCIGEPFFAHVLGDAAFNSHVAFMDFGPFPERWPKDSPNC